MSRNNRHINFVIDELETGNGITYQNIDKDTGNCHAYGFPTNQSLDTVFDTSSCNRIGTNWGISGRLYSKLKKDTTATIVTKQTMQQMTRNEAYDIYESVFWREMWFDQWQDDDFVTLVFSYAVHRGSPKATRPLQEILNKDFKENLTVDGAFGAKTMGALKRAYATDLDTLYKRYFDAQQSFYQSHPTFANAFQHRLDKIASNRVVPIKSAPSQTTVLVDSFVESTKRTSKNITSKPTNAIIVLLSIAAIVGALFFIPKRQLRFRPM